MDLTPEDGSPQPSAPTNAVPTLVDHLFRRQAGELVAGLTGALGPAHLDLAEDVVQEALLSALRTWPYRGIPDRPAAWLARVAKNRALDRLRRATDLAGHLAALQSWAPAEPHRTQPIADLSSTPEPDEEPNGDVLRMMFVVCHPCLSREARVALTLKTVCGFGVAEIARAFLVNEVTIAQRLVRAKHRIRERGLSFEMPSGAELVTRLDSVLEAVYLVFNEGYAAHGGEALVRMDCVDEALRLANLITDRLAGPANIAPHSGSTGPKAHALAALLYLQAARLPARVGEDGELCLLSEQDRGLWDRARLARGFDHLRRASAGEALSTYHLEAGIAAQHAAAPTFEATDWAAILHLYDQLVARSPSPVVRLNRAVAVAQTSGAAAGLGALEELRDAAVLADYYLAHALRAEFQARLGNRSAALESIEAALACSCSEPERRLLERRRREYGAESE